MTTKIKEEVASMPISIEKTLDELFELKGKEKDLKAQISAIQERVNIFSDEHYGDFVEGELALTNGVIKIKSNPPKFVHENSMKALTTKERADFAAELPKDYIELKPNMSKIVARFNGDKLLKKQLQSKGIAVVQDVRYDARPY